MFVNFEMLIMDDTTGQYNITPIIVNTDDISYICPSYQYKNVSIIIFRNGGSILVNGAFNTINKILTDSNNTRLLDDGSTMFWNLVQDGLPKINDDFIVALKQPAGYTVNVDFFKNGKWESFGKKVVAWMPFPTPPNA